MTIQKRLPVVLALLAILAPVSASLPVAAMFQERYAAEEQLDQVLNRAAASYASGRGLPFLLHRYEEEAKAKQKELMALARQKRALRLERAAVRDQLAALTKEYGLQNQGTGSVVTTVEKRESMLSSFAHLVGIRSLLPYKQESIARRLVHSSLGEMTDTDIRETVTGKVLVALTGMSTLQAKRDTLQKEHEALLLQYGVVAGELATAEKGRMQTAERMRAVQRTVEEVHAEVIRIQSQLARIDAQLRSKAERDLIEKGLRGPQENAHASAKAARPQFAPPAHGRSSANYLDEAYELFFGVPHKGVDIGIPQGSPVFSAADGIVFLARDGGETGYSYILIGHRDGYATLYGHVSQILVEPGQDVTIGQTIAVSGGAPGTHGAGPMTTGAHLHFEVIHNGEHIDPQTILSR